jgi:membrane fusion protein (multidrug efflux system)
VPHRPFRLIRGIALAIGTFACGGPDESVAPVPEVVVAPVEQRDVEIFSEWVGTLTGNVNAQIYPKIEGYLLRQAYTDGGRVQEGDLLFQIDPRQFRAALDEARGQLARAQASLG